MTTVAVKTNVLRGLGESCNVTVADYLAAAQRWINSAYDDILGRYRFKTLRTRSIFRTTDGQQTYQAPGDFSGFITLKDETNGTVIDQITPEEFARSVDATDVTDETFTSSFGVAVSLDNKAIVQYSEKICDDADETTTYTRDTDYTMDYVSGTITVLATGSMSDATTYYANYLYYPKGTPTSFCMEYDATNGKYVFRLDPVPSATNIMSIVYPAFPSDLSASVNAIWSQMEYAVERGGVYFGSLELMAEPNLMMMFEKKYEQAIQSLIQLDLDLVPKHDRIPLVMRKSDYTSRSVRPIGRG